jgi:acyl-CoA reductase-like NAD-dependent aldehyde dehydrogenase
MATLTGIAPHPIYLAGRWVDSPEVLVVENPARPGEPAGATYQATPEQYEEAVEAAVRAFQVTRKLPAYERGRILREISASIKARREELGALIAAEAGKPIRDALVEVDRAVLTFRLGAEEAERMTGEVIPLDLMPERATGSRAASRSGPWPASAPSTSRSTWQPTRSRRLSRRVVRSCSSRPPGTHSPC